MRCAAATDRQPAREPGPAEQRIGQGLERRRHRSSRCRSPALGRIGRDVPRGPKRRGDDRPIAAASATRRPAVPDRLRGPRRSCRPRRRRRSRPGARTAAISASVGAGDATISSTDGWCTRSAAARPGRMVEECRPGQVGGDRRDRRDRRIPRQVQGTPSRGSVASVRARAATSASIAPMLAPPTPSSRPRSPPPPHSAAAHRSGRALGAARASIARQPRHPQRGFDPLELVAVRGRQEGEHPGIAAATISVRSRGALVEGRHVQRIADGHAVEATRREQVGHHRAGQGPGSVGSPVSAGTATWLDITRRAPAAIPARIAAAPSPPAVARVATTAAP